MVLSDDLVEACRRGEPDVVMVDLCMPRVDGLAVVRALSRDESTRRIPVVVVSATGLDAETRQVLASEANVRRAVDKLAGVRAIRAALAQAEV